MSIVVAVVLIAVIPELILDGFESCAAPKIGGFDIIGCVGVESFIGRNVLVELMDEQEDGIELSCIRHEGIERCVGIILSEAQGVVGAVG